MNKKIFSMLSLAQRAGKLLSGEQTVEKAIRSNEALLVITAADAAENTINKFSSKAKYYNIKHISISSKDELNHAIGKINRTVFAITDTNFASKISELLDNTENMR